MAYIQGRGNRTEGCAKLTTSKTLSLLAASVSAIHFACLVSVTQSFAGGPPPPLFVEGAKRELARFFADAGLYAAKRAGRNQVILHAHVLDDEGSTHGTMDC